MAKPLFLNSLFNLYHDNITSDQDKLIIGSHWGLLRCGYSTMSQGGQDEIIDWKRSNGKLIIHYNALDFEFDAEFYDDEGTLTATFIHENTNVPVPLMCTEFIVNDEVQAQKLQSVLENTLRNFMKKCKAKGMPNKSTVNQPNTTVTNVRGANSIGLNTTNPDMNVVSVGNPDSGDSGSGDLRSGDSRSGGSRSGDPQFSGSRSGGLQFGGSRSGDPQFSGSRSGGLQFGGSRSGDPQFSGSRSGGLQFGGSRSGDPDHAVTDENSPDILRTPPPVSTPPKTDYSEDF